LKSLKLVESQQEWPPHIGLHKDYTISPLFSNT